MKSKKPLLVTLAMLSTVLASCNTPATSLESSQESSAASSNSTQTSLSSAEVSSSEISSAEVSSSSSSSSSSSVHIPVVDYSLSIKSLPTKVSYFVGQTLDTDGLEVELETITDGISETSTLLPNRYSLSIANGSLLTEVNPSKAITVTYLGAENITASFNIEVKEHVYTYQLDVVSLPSVTTFYIADGDTFSTEGLLSQVRKYQDGILMDSELPIDVPTENLVITGFEEGYQFVKADIGIHSIDIKATVEEVEYQASFEIVVSSGYTYNLAANFNGGLYTYFVGQKLTKADISATLSITDKNGYAADPENIAQYNNYLPNSMYDLYLGDELIPDEGKVLSLDDANKNIIAKYTTLDGDVISATTGWWDPTTHNPATYPLQISDGGNVTTSLAVSNRSAMKTSYKAGESLDITGIKLNLTFTPTTGSAVIREFDKNQIMNSFDLSIQNGEALEAGEQDLVITYKFDDNVSTKIKLTVAANKPTISFVDAEGNALSSVKVDDAGKVSYVGALPEKATSEEKYMHWFKGWAKAADATEVLDLDTEVFTASETLYPIFTSINTTDIANNSRYAYTFGQSSSAFYGCPDGSSAITAAIAASGDQNSLLLAGGALSYSHWGVVNNVNVTLAYGSPMYSLPSKTNVNLVIGNGITDVKSFSGFSSFLGSLVLSSTVTTIASSSFKGVSSLTSVTYNGTKAQWANVSVGTDAFLNTGVSVIHCVDGDVTL